MNAKEKNIDNIYVGKLDARFEDISAFEDSNMNFPPNIDIEGLVKGDKYYITGNKGTGKTALLLYLSNKIAQNDENAICSTILFKTDYNTTERIKIETIERRIVDTLDIGSVDMNSIQDFTNIWRLTVFLKIVCDNKESQYKLFAPNTNWNAFENLVLRLAQTVKIGTKERISMLQSIPKEIRFSEELNLYTISEEQVSIENANDIQLVDFNDALDISEYLFSHLERKDATYFICIDELETYCGYKSFRRDLQMVHDWIEVAWSLNQIIKDASYKKMKIILSVRTEILRSIEKYLGGDELNKKIGSYRIIVDWKSKYWIGIRNPIFAIWLKRIARMLGDYTETDYEKIRQKWFPSTIGVQDTVDFILDRTWNKPRDIIRYMSLSVKAYPGAQTFSKNSIIDVLETYSEESKSEIMEEMSALYSSENVDLIFSSLKKFKSCFTKKEYQQHIEENYGDYPLFECFDNILEDMYRYGILGCENIDTKEVNWYYQGEINMKKGLKWRYYIHKGLRPILGLESIVKDDVNIYDIMAVPLNCIVTRATQAFIFVEFYFNEKIHKGAIHVSKWRERTYIYDISQYVTIGEEIVAYALNYDETHLNWVLTCRL